jgi:hypothetical protein
MGRVSPAIATRGTGLVGSTPKTYPAVRREVRRDEKSHGGAPAPAQVAKSIVAIRNSSTRNI